MIECIYCGQEITNNQLPDFVGGQPIHEECNCKLNEDLAEHEHFCESNSR